MKVLASQHDKYEGHLHVLCESTDPERGCTPKPHIHYDRSGWCVGEGRHQTCRGTYHWLHGKISNCVCDCHEGEPVRQRIRRRVRRLIDTIDYIPLTERLRGA